MKYTHQKSTDKLWIDESGQEIPYNRITKNERLNERLASKIAKEALSTHHKLVAFNKLITDYSHQAYDAFMKSKDIHKKRKGNFLWFNFDRSIKIEIDVNSKIDFDSLTITAAKHKLDEFLDLTIKTEEEFVKDIIIGAFETKRSGDLDTKQVMKLTSYESRIKSPLFHEAMKLIRSAIRRPTSKTYRRISIKDENGKYQTIVLNASSL